jgi:hypothetical protein
MTIATVLLISYLWRDCVSKPESLVPCMLNKNFEYGFLLASA